MRLEPKWLARELWTLLEAAQVCAGIEPFGGGPATDVPAHVLRGIADSSTRTHVEELYARSKDAIDTGRLAHVGSRTGTYGNFRVRPLEYWMWARSYGLPVSPDVQFPPAPMPDVRYGHRLALTKFGYTVDGAALALKEQCGADEDKWRKRMFAATKSGELRVRDPLDGAYYTPERPSEHWERISIADLNRWFSDLGTSYSLDEWSPEPSDRSGEHSVSRTRIIDGFRVKRGEQDNFRFWDDKLSRPPIWLAGALVSKGKRGVSNQWNPALVAHALLGKDHMTIERLDLAMVAFPEWEAEWKQQTENDR